MIISTAKKHTNEHELCHGHTIVLSRSAGLIHVDLVRHTSVLGDKKNPPFPRVSPITDRTPPYIMSKPPPPPRAKSATDVRRTLFRSLSRTAGAATTTTNLASTSNIPGPDSADEDAEAAAPEGIIVRRKDSSMDIEIPLTTSQHAQLLDGIGRELAEQQRLAAELVKRHQVDAYKQLPSQSLRYRGSELLRLQVLSLAQDSWMFESDEEC